MTCEVPTKRCLYKVTFVIFVKYQLNNNSPKFLTLSKLFANFNFTTGNVS